MWLASIHCLPQRAPAKGEDPATVPTVPGTARAGVGMVGWCYGGEGMHLIALQHKQ